MADNIVEVIVVVNSPKQDGTFDSASRAVNDMTKSNKHSFTVHDAKKRLGKGGAVKLGMKMAGGKYKLFMDADLSTPLHNIRSALSLAKQNKSDAVIGVRDLSTMHKTFLRKISSKASNSAIQILILPGFKDTQCGFKLFTDQASDIVFSKLTSTSWSFDMEALLIARQNKLNITELPIKDWSDPKQEGLSGDNQLKVMASELKELLRFRMLKSKGAYKSRSIQQKSSL